MTINPTQPGGIRTNLAPESADASKVSAQAAQAGPVPGEQVEISAEARALAEQGEVERVPFTPTRLAEIRSLVANGHFDTPEMADRVAGRLLESGDL